MHQPDSSSESFRSVRIVLSATLTAFRHRYASPAASASQLRARYRTRVGPSVIAAPELKSGSRLSATVPDAGRREFSFRHPAPSQMGDVEVHSEIDGVYEGCIS